MMDNKNIETALEHLENARKILETQLKEMQAQASEERAALEKEKALLNEERRQFEEQKANILASLQNIHEQLQQEMQEEEPEGVKEELPLLKEDAPVQVDTPSEKTFTLGDTTSSASFLELDEEEIPVTEKALKKTKKSDKEVDTPVLGAPGPVSDLASSIQHLPLKDLVKGMGINDRFLFTKELFDGNDHTFNEVVKKLNNLGNLPEATAYLSRYSDKWNLESEVVKQFMLLVHRRYL